MSDSFFTTRNVYDEQVRHMSETHCEMIIEAATRRFTELRGPSAASGRHYRLADICAGAYVLPVDHWQTPPPEPPAPAAPSLRDRIARGWKTTEQAAWWAGVAAGILLGYAAWGMHF